MAERRPPLPVRLFAAVVPRLPIGRYWAVSQLRRLRTAPFLMPLPPSLGGFVYTCDPRDSVAREVCYTGGYEPQETALAGRILGTGDVFVDVGANWGYFSLAAAHWVGPGGRVVAFEPEPRLYRLLTANLEANRLVTVVAHQAAVAAGSGRLAFAAFSAEDGNWGVSRAIAGGAPSDFDCDAVALDAALDADGVADVQLVKIDVEGGEAGVLAGMARGLARGRYRHLLLECHPSLLAARGESARGCIEPLLAAGYRVWLIDHSPAAHRRAAAGTVTPAGLLRPYAAGAALEAWPHVLALAPGVPELA
ncbi:MAG: FkbM family methyltransferase [Acidobacteriota bacterium]